MRRSSAPASGSVSGVTSPTGGLLTRFLSLCSYCSIGFFAGFLAFPGAGSVDRDMRAETFWGWPRTRADWADCVDFRASAVSFATTADLQQLAVEASTNWAARANKRSRTLRVPVARTCSTGGILPSPPPPCRARPDDLCSPHPFSLGSARPTPLVSLRLPYVGRLYFRSLYPPHTPRHHPAARWPPFGSAPRVVGPTLRDGARYSPRGSRAARAPGGFCPPPRSRLSASPSRGAHRGDCFPAPPHSHGARPAAHSAPRRPASRPPARATSRPCAGPARASSGQRVHRSTCSLRIPSSVVVVQAEPP